MTNQIIERYTNTEDGVEARIATHVKGYRVTLTDTDAGQTLPDSIICPTIDKARATARSWAGV